MIFSKTSISLSIAGKDLDVTISLTKTSTSHNITGEDLKIT